MSRAHKSQEPFAQWRQAALELEDVQPPTLPIHVLLGEAVDVARFVDLYWEPAEEAGGKLRPGLREAGKRVSKKLSAELLELQAAVQAAQTAYLLAGSPTPTDLRERALFVVQELIAALEWLFDDGVEDENDRALATLKEEHGRIGDSLDALASELSDYAALAERHAGELDGIGGFEVALIAEARQLAAALRDQGAPAAGRSEEVDALDLRNRLAALLTERIALARNAARFVFRHYPAIVRQATSAYQRKRRAASRRSAAATPDEAPATTTPS